MKHILSNVADIGKKIEIFSYKVLIVLAVVALTSLTAGAESAIGRVSKNDFNLIIKQWKFECNDPEVLKYNPDVADYMSQIVPDIIWKGLSEVALQNEDLVARIFRNIKTGAAVTISCGYSDDVRAAGEMVTTHIKPIFKIGKFTFGIPTGEKSELKLGKAVIECMLSDKIKKLNRDEARQQEFVGVNNEILPYEVKASELIKENCHQTVFHEFLHLAKVDNKSVEEHNSGNTKESENSIHQLDDVVYACARMAFRYGSAAKTNVNHVFESYFPASMTRNTWVKSCRTCTMAQFQHSSVGKNENPLEDDRAHYSCNKLYDEIPNLGEPYKKSESAEAAAVTVAQ